MLYRILQEFMDEIIWEKNCQDIILKQMALSHQQFIKSKKEFSFIFVMFQVYTWLKFLGITYKPIMYYFVIFGTIFA